MNDNGEIKISRIKSAPPNTAPIFLETTMIKITNKDIRMPSAIAI